MLDSRYERLIETVMPLIGQLLLEQRAFLPFAAALDDQGSVSLVDATDDLPDEGEIDVDAIYDSVVEVLRQNAERLEAIAICSDSEAIPPGSEKATDVILVTLESKLTPAIQLGIPYRFDRKGTPLFGETFTAAADAEILT